eukprot:755797-Hanusia_phi.AAC.9
MFATIRMATMLARSLDPSVAAQDIISGVSGNYEKSMENSAAASKDMSRNTNSDYRGIASDIIDTAYVNVVDLTGKVGADGTPVSHGMFEDPRMNCPGGIGCANA